MSGDEVVHGSVFAYQGAGCLLLGESGSGKSKLTGEAMLFGAKFVADDQVQLSILQGMLSAGAVPNIAGVLELPGYGLIRVNDYNPKQVIHLIVELTKDALERLPPPQTKEFLGIKLPLLKLPPVPNTTIASLLLYLRAMQEGRVLPQDWLPAKK